MFIVGEGRCSSALIDRARSMGPGVRRDDESKKGPGRNRGPIDEDEKAKPYLSVRCLSAVPRMSPSVAPESEEPYCAMASFSSATSSALIDTCTLRAFLSNWI